MKSLKEALLNRPKNIDVARMTQTAAEEYINANYNHSGELTFENVNGVCIVNCDSDVAVKNRKIIKLTDGFVWGKVKGAFYCVYCSNLISLEGAPKEVGGNFTCTRCTKIESLEGAPEYVGGSFNCFMCYNLISLKGAPKEVGGTFDCYGCNELESLEGAPKEVGGDFNCTYCVKLKSLEGVPEKIGGQLIYNTCY